MSMSVTMRLCFLRNVVLRQQCTRTSCGFCVVQNVSLVNSFLNITSGQNKIGKRSLLCRKTWISCKNSSNLFHAGDDLNNKAMKVHSTNLPSLRIDMVLKAALQVSRNKIETSFYESKIRINGVKVNKKSMQIKEGDEVDVVSGSSPMNPDFLLVSRIEVVDIEEKEDGYTLKFRRFKSLTIENYREI